jgi:hypothetical protein
VPAFPPEPGVPLVLLAPEDEDEDEDEDEAPWLGEPEGGWLLSPQALMNSTRHHPEAYLFITLDLAQLALSCTGNWPRLQEKKAQMAMPGRHAPEQIRRSSGRTA